MSKETFIEAMGQIDDRLLDRYMEAEDRLTGKKPWAKWIAIAACICLIAGTIIYQLPPPVPSFENASFTAAEIGKLFNNVYAEKGSTSSYTKVYVPNEKYLHLCKIPETDVLPIYTGTDVSKELDENEFRTIAGDVISNLCDATQMPVPEFEAEQDTIDGSDRFTVSVKTGYFDVYISQNNLRHYFNLSPLASPVTLGDSSLQIDQRQSDAQIMESLADIKETLFQIFGTSFQDAKIVRTYGNDNPYGANYVDIYFYNRNDHPLNEYRNVPYSDYLRIGFNNYANDENDIASASILTKASIFFYRNRVTIMDQKPEISQAKMMSLADAEALLYNGYVFGGHSCPLCMAAQNKVSFRGYDDVGFEYVSEYDPTTRQFLIAIPFYTFYKQIGTAENGNIIYAKTYVPAVEVSGLEEYFEMQKNEH